MPLAGGKEWRLGVGGREGGWGGGREVGSGRPKKEGVKKYVN